MTKLQPMAFTSIKALESSTSPVSKEHGLLKTLDTGFMKPLFTLITLQHLQIPAEGGKNHYNSASCILYPQFSATYDSMPDLVGFILRRNTSDNSVFSNSVCVLHLLARSSTVAVALLDVGLVALVPH